MAFNYKCGQFDDSFSAKRLGNWSENSRPCRPLRTRRGVYVRRRCPSKRNQLNCGDFIANDSGHLLAEAKANVCKKANHWGYPVVGVWDELFQCCDGHSQKKNSRREVNRSFDDMPQFFRCRSPLARCANAGSSVLDDYNTKYALDLEYCRLQDRSPPVIWIYGYHQKRIEDQRLRLTGLLAKKLGFIYINPERILTVLAMRYLHYCPRKNSKAWYWAKDGKTGGFFSIFTELPATIQDCPPSIQRIVGLLENILCLQSSEAFNTRGILEIIKMLLVTFPHAKGYILDGFPVSLSEADEYEREFWPVAAGIYFTSKHWRDLKSRGYIPTVVLPSLFLRNTDYLESLVQNAADEFGEICVQINDTECLSDRDFAYILCVVKNLIKKYSITMRQEEMEYEDSEKDSCEESSTPCSLDTCATSPPEPEPEPEEEVEEPPESDESVHSVESDLERLIIEQVENVKEVEPQPKPTVKDYYRHEPKLYSHDIPDSAGVETEFSSALRHHYVADLLKKKQRRADDNPLMGTDLILDPAKPELPRPANDNILFGENKDVAREDVQLDEASYVQKVLKLEQEKMAKDLADREYRRRLSHTTYRTEPAAYPKTVHTLFPPEKREFKEDTEFSYLKPRTGEKAVRYEDQLKDVFHPEEKAIALEDEKIQKTYVPSANWFDKHEQILKYERTKKGFDPRRLRKKKKTVFDKVKSKWSKFRRYLKPVPRPKEALNATDKLRQYAREHRNEAKDHTVKKKKSSVQVHVKPIELEREFRYD